MVERMRPWLVDAAITGVLILGGPGTVRGVDGSHFRPHGMPLIMLCEYAAAWIFGDMRWQDRRISRLLEDQRLKVTEQADLQERLATSEERARIARDTDSLLGRAVESMLRQADRARQALP